MELYTFSVWDLKRIQFPLRGETVGTSSLRNKQQHSLRFALAPMRPAQKHKCCKSFTKVTVDEKSPLGF